MPSPTSAASAASAIADTTKITTLFAPALRNMNVATVAMTATTIITMALVPSDDIYSARFGSWGFCLTGCHRLKVFLLDICGQFEPKLFQPLLNTRYHLLDLHDLGHG